MGAYAVGKFSGAHLNPAVSIALAMDGSLVGLKYLAILSVKCLRYLGGVLVWLMYLPHWKATEDQGQS